MQATQPNRHTVNEPHCVWCLYVLGRVRPGNHQHHVFGRHYGLTIPMCQHHHSESYHSEGSITRQDIIDKVLVPHYWNGEDKSGAFTRRIEP